MKPFLMFLAVTAVLTAAFFSFIHVVGKTMKPKHVKDPIKSIDAITPDLTSTQSQRVKDLRLKQKKLLEERQDRLRDMQR